jgi:predicted ATPase/class 3 adenylate cyclase
MPELPAGTVTFLFTDIEGSTRLWEQHPEPMRAALARHDALAAAFVEAHAGTLVKSRGEGDSLFAVFPRATDALAAAVAFQQALIAEPWPAEVSLRVRMALHTGEADLRAGSYYGSEVNRCARLRAVAHGGQVLLSRTTYDLVRDTLPEGASLRDLGEQRLRDLTRPEHVFQLLHPELPADFPPLNTLEARPNNLPVQPTPLIGREQELAALRGLLARDAARLVTLTGPGGTGKTRLALQTAADLLDEFADGVFFIDLAPISDPELVASAIAQPLGVRESGGQPLRESLKASLREKQVLLVLDNFEQVLAAAPLVAELLAAAPRLKALVTSRALLRLRGEKEFSVPPLSLPEPRQFVPLETLSQYGAVALFIQRAQDARPDFAVTNETAPAVAEICSRLDGLPLAIELAAARVKLFSPAALLSRLESRLKLLVGGPRDLPARQQTLRDAIGWSYDLLGEGEKALFRRLAVFVGGCTLEAAEAVCNAEGDLGADVLEGVAVLVEQSLLRQEEGLEGEPRFTMLETIREYAVERLEESGEAEAVRWLHAQHFLTLAEEAEVGLFQLLRLEAMERLAQEHDNLRAALAWCRTEPGGGETGLRLVAALGAFWHFYGHLSEGRSLSEEILKRPPAAERTPARARGLLTVAVMSAEQSDWLTAQALGQESLEIWRQIGDRRGLAHTLTVLAGSVDVPVCTAEPNQLAEEALVLFRELENERDLATALVRLGWMAEGRGDLATARSRAEEGAALFRKLGEKRCVVPALNCLAWVAIGSDNLAWARDLASESVSIARQTGDRLVLSWALSMAGDVARMQGDWSAARSHYEESLTLQRGVRHAWSLMIKLVDLGRVALEQGDRTAAERFFTECLVMGRDSGIKGWTVACLEGLARVACAREPHSQGARQAARLLGAVEALRGDTSLPPEDRAGFDDLVTEARAQLDEATFAAAWAEGRSMPLEQAIGSALEGASDIR